MSANNNNNSSKESEVFLKCLSKYYQNEPDTTTNYRKIKLRDAVVKAYNKKYKTNLKAFQLISKLRKRNNIQPFQPYEWEKLFLDEFIEIEETPFINKDRPHDAEDHVIDLEVKQEIIKEEPIDILDVHQDAESAVSVAAPESSANNCEPDVSTALKEKDYKTMSIYELKRALLVSKLEMLDAQQALAKARENIRLNEEEHMKRQIDQNSNPC